MKNGTSLFKKASLFTKIEFWAISTIFAFIIFIHIMDAFAWDDRGFIGAPYKEYYDKVNMPFLFYRNYFQPLLVTYLVFYFYILYFQFVAVAQIIKRKNLVRNIVILVLVFAITGLILGTVDTYLNAYLYSGAPRREDVTVKIFLGGFDNVLNITSVVIVYNAIKYAGKYLFTISESVAAKYQYIRGEAVVALVLWITGILVLRFARAEREILIGWSIVLPSAIALYLYSFYRLIPRAVSRKRFRFIAYFLRGAFASFLLFVIIYAISLFIIEQDDAGAGYAAFNSFFQLFVTVPVSWLVYKRYHNANEHLQYLQQEIRQSSANYDFLRSQINPHFLFNALNTLYGTAIQENAERTSEGIQKLGDMMRFMLQENISDKIPLSREIDYLKNYIDLQKLRTNPSPEIKIDIHIEEPAVPFEVAPMLLIPFVENAFKHGISFRKDSYIKISLEFRDNTLFCDVANSKHQKKDNDPESSGNGIGLVNVKERLHLLYKKSHKLIIRETANDFFVHLTLKNS